jgi:hypothetical protein
MILSARAIASEMADSDAGEFSPVPLRQFSCCEDASRDQGTRFLPSSMSASVTHSLFIRHKRIYFFIIDFRICTAGYGTHEVKFSA